MSAEQLELLINAIRALHELGDEDSIHVLTLVDRLLRDDFTGTSLYPSIDKALADVGA